MTANKIGRSYLEVDDDDIRRRVGHARFDLYSTMLKAENRDQHDFRDIINILISVIQQPITFCLLRKSANSGKSRYTKIYSFLKDSKYADIFETELRRLLCSSNLEEYLYRVVDNHYVVCFRVHFDDTETDYATKKDVKFVPVCKSSVYNSSHKQKHSDESLDYSISRVSDIDEYIARTLHVYFNLNWHASESAFSSAFQNYLTDCVANITNISTIRRLPTKMILPKETFYRLKKDGTANYSRISFADWANTLESRLDDYFYDISGKLRIVEKFMSNNESLLPNYLIAVRAFCRQGLRHTNGGPGGGYDYDVKFLISESHSQKIKKFFSDLFSGGITIPPEAHYSKQGHRLCKSADSFFWNKFGRLPDAPQLCVNVLKSIIGDSVRSFNDPVFTSGTIHLHFPFKNGGLSRIQNIDQYKKFDDLPGDIYSGGLKQDVLRIVIAYYLSYGMVPRLPGSDSGNIMLALMPIQVGGAITAVSGHFFFVQDMAHIYSNRQYWKSFYILCSDVRGHISRYMRSIYRDCQFDYTEMAIFDELSNINSYGHDIDRGNISWTLDEAILKANYVLEQLKYYSPYDSISFSDESEKDKEVFVVAELQYLGETDKIIFHMSLIRNDIFPKFKYVRHPTAAIVRRHVELTIRRAERIAYLNHLLVGGE